MSIGGGGGGGPAPTYNREGYSKKELDQYQTMANVLSVGNVSTTDKMEAPQRLRYEYYENNGKRKGVSGFTGEFSDLSDEEVNRRIQYFEDRETFLIGQRRAPGIKQLTAKR